MTHKRASRKDYDANVIIFGGVGDLSLRKILPALYNSFRQNNLSDTSQVMCVSRKKFSRKEFTDLLNGKVPDFIGKTWFDQEVWDAFLNNVTYVQVDLADSGAYAPLKDALEKAPDYDRIFYMSVASFLYTPACEGLAQNGLIREQSRVVMEKPLGDCEEAAEEIRAAITKYFKEENIYRIDHYLGKEPVQNLLSLRFGNKLFEPLWNARHIDNVQITVAETLGVGTRAGFYESTGCMRDMIQNHVLQLLCIVAMEPPNKYSSDAVRDEKIKVIRALRRIHRGNAAKYTVRGQYRPGVSEGKPVVGYLDEQDVAQDSNTETFVAIKAMIDNWRWADVPFYLRSGKRLGRKVAQVVITFKKVPHSIFTESSDDVPDNRLIIELQPDESIRLIVNGKKVGTGMDLMPVTLDLDVDEMGEAYRPEAYERLIFDCIKGQPTLFVRGDELIEAWRWVDPILECWAENGTSLEKYTAGTMGPPASTLLLARDNRLWFEE
jgi:glucose-6-phosphate 1-dehydrogenase